MICVRVCHGARSTLQDSRDSHTARSIRPLTQPVAVCVTGRVTAGWSSFGVDDWYPGSCRPGNRIGAACLSGWHRTPCRQVRISFYQHNPKRAQGVALSAGVATIGIRAYSSMVRAGDSSKGAAVQECMDGNGMNSGKPQRRRRGRWQP